MYIAIDGTKYSVADGSLGFSGDEDSVFGLGGYKDGHEDIADAASRGATVIIIDKVVEPIKDITYILVEDSLQAIINLARYHIQKCMTKIIAVTGSVGKTTTVNVIYESFKQYVNIEKIHRIRNTVLGLAVDILLNVTRKTEYLVIEMQSDGLGQIESFCQIVDIDYAIITSIKRSHLSKFQTIEKILQEKTSLYKHLKDSGKILINGNDAKLYNWSEHLNDSRVKRIGTDKNFDYSYSNLRTRESGCTLSLTSIGETVEKNIPINSEDFVWSTVFMHSLAKEANIKINESNPFIAGKSTVTGRNQVYYGRKGALVIIDSYNGSYLSFCNGIEHLYSFNKKKNILILGSMLELGKEAETYHRKLGKFISNFDVDMILGMGESMLYTIDELKKSNTQCKMIHTFCYEDVESEINKLSFDKNTAIYLKGAGAMRMELLSPSLLSEKKISGM